MLLTYDELNLMTDYLNSNDKIIIQNYVSAEEFNYTNPVLIVIDPILSQFRKYDVIKKNNLDYFRDNFSDSINTLQQIVDIYEQEGYEGLVPIINYSAEIRITTIYQTCKAFINYRNTHGFKNDLEAMKDWAIHAEQGDSINSVKGIGIATFQYLQMLLGVDTVKPDVHIINFFEEQIGKKFNEKRAILAFTELANHMDVKLVNLDHAIWLFKSKYGKTFNNVSKVKLLINDLNQRELKEVQKYIDSKLETT